MSKSRVNLTLAIGLGAAMREFLESIPARMAIFTLRMNAVTNGFDPDIWEERARRRSRESELELVDAANEELAQMRRMIEMRKRRRL